MRLLLAATLLALAACSADSGKNEDTRSSAPVESEVADAAPMDQDQILADSTTRDEDQEKCEFTAHELRAMGCTPATPEFCVNPKTGQPYCGIGSWISTIHERDPRFDEALKLLSEPEIFGGKKVHPEDYLETVMITPSSTDRARLCSGVLLHPNVVLTARHCVRDGVAQEGSEITFGKSYDTGIYKALATSVSVPTNDPIPARDIALLWLSEPVPQTIEPASIASDDDVDAAMNTGSSHNRALARLAGEEDATAAFAARIVGYGYNEQFKSGEKLFADIGVVTANCDSGFTDRRSQEYYTDRKYYECIEGEELVAGAVRPWGAISIDTCNGDSGGPIFIAPAADARSGTKYKQAIAPSRDDHKAGYLLAGITSRAVESDYIPAGEFKCGNGGIYVRLRGQNLQWIEDEMAERGYSLSAGSD